MATAFEKFLSTAGNIPGVKVNRNEFLKKAFKDKCANAHSLEKIIAEGPAKAGVPAEMINKLADEEIKNITLTATGLSFLTGLPGGVAMIAAIPADLAQLYAHVFIIVQKLMYLYGWEDDVFDESGNIDSETQTMVILYLGLMFGIGAASKPLANIAAKVSVKYINKAAIKALSNKTVRAVVVRIVKAIGIKTVAKGGWKYFTKAVPVVGGVISGALTLATIVPMAKRLKKYLSERDVGKLDLSDDSMDDLEDSVIELDCESEE